VKKHTVRLHIQRSVGHTSLSLEAPAEQIDHVVAHALDILDKMPESTFSGDGVAITSIPGFGPRDER
jgi:hypothetical protein